ncbi:MAG: hypothetical protein JXA15_04300 [Spirochaetales bacterium]|nr:hypothetical protein [Spirochaetales bacterium]
MRIAGKRRAGPRRGFSRLRLALVVPMLSLFAAALGVSWTLSMINTRAAMRVTALRLAEEIGAHAAESVTDFLARPLAVGEAVAAWASLQRGSPGDAEAMDRLAASLRATLALFPEINLVSVGFTDGEYVESQRLDDGTLRVGRSGAATGGALELWNADEQGYRTTLARSIPSYDPRTRPWYQRAASSGRTGWSEPYALVSDGSFALAASVPVYSRGEFRGVATVDLALERIGTLIGGVVRAEDGLLAIVDDRGFLVAVTDGSPTLTGTGDAALRIAAQDSPSPIVADLARGRRPAWTGGASAGVALFESGGVTYLGASGHVKTAGSDWTVLVALSEASFMAPLERADRQNLALLGLSLAGVLAAAWAVADRVVGPVLLLADTAARLVPGETGAAAAVAGLARRQDEIGSLAASFIDLERRLEESFASLSRSLEEKEVLLREVHHRVKNNLQVISSILSIQASELADSRAREAFAVCQDRIQTMAYVHEDLYQSGTFSDISMDSYLGRILEGLQATVGVTGSVELALVPGGVRLPLEKAIPCGLVVNELVTNALKHAFPSGRPGSIKVGIRREADGVLELAVADDGVGMGGGAIREGGIGRHLVASLVAQLGGLESTRLEGGVSVSVRFA